ncbi:flavin-containing monooxygenase [Enterovirga rhinocerotis]|uniref:Putative flavoprotein involved in K+ transport n=1 Tax=Enterovirga rhinocerotis TaxID=1339210 RepID=A0A4R7BGX8_9HYPH|nr:NAD(P)/FAD-dependent oxidoreductase [Enterovirga rhinocerotis]TDR84510.1 putative flavoprotein involved in K+ transport [Enterovirga rhinocerotis]
MVVRPNTLAETWVGGFWKAIQANALGGVASLFLEDGSWRDICGFEWDIDTAVGPDEIEAAFNDKLAGISIRTFRLSEARTAPRLVRRAGRDVVEAFVDFETSVGRGSGVVRLVPDPARPSEAKAWILLTALDEIHDHPEVMGSQAPDDEAFKREFGGKNWLDIRTERSRYLDRHPRVLVIGAGQAGLTIGARLGALGIDTLIIDRNDEVGDNWRNRYHALALHNEVYGNHLPYMPFPATFPRFVPKDKLASWFRSYADVMDLNVWTKTSLVDGSYDDRARQWTIRVSGPDGIRIVRPAHVVFATGVSAIPIQPSLPGLEDFAGEVVHSGAYGSGHRWAGRNAVVLGTGNSGHDVAQDLHASGAKVSMIQRSPTTVLSLKEAQKLYSLYNEGLPLDDADLLSIAVPHPVLIRSYQQLTTSIRAADKELLGALEARGFRLDFGDDGTGFQMKYLTRGGGYYFNVGCSDLIVSGEVDLLQYSDIERFVPDGIRMKDGGIRPVDLLVTATGFKNQQDVVREFLGDEIADRTGPVWGFGEERELRNMWKRTPQPGLWFNAGSLAQCRIFSKYLALQILACELGLIDEVQEQSRSGSSPTRTRPTLEPA